MRFGDLKHGVEVKYVLDYWSDVVTFLRGMSLWRKVSWR